MVVGSGEKLCFHKDCPGLMPETGGDGVLRTLSHWVEHFYFGQVLWTLLIDKLNVEFIYEHMQRIFWILFCFCGKHTPHHNATIYK